MISWFTESALVPMIVGTFLALAFLGLAISFRDRIMLFLAMVIATLTAGTVITETLIVTDRESIVEIVSELARMVENNNMAGVLSHVSQQRDDCKQKIRLEMPRCQFRTCRITGINRFSSSKSAIPTAEIEFVAIATGKHMSHGLGTVQRAVWLKFEKNSTGKWEMIDYDHWDPRAELKP
jgi:hypothetical protein